MYRRWFRNHGAAHRITAVDNDSAMAGTSPHQTAIACSNPLPLPDHGGGASVPLLHKPFTTVKLGELLEMLVGPARGELAEVYRKSVPSVLRLKGIIVASDESKWHLHLQQLVCNLRS